jgi:hypothetical protein
LEKSKRNCIFVIKIKILIMARRKLHRYTGNEVASQPSIAEQLLRGTKIGN